MLGDVDPIIQKCFLYFFDKGAENVAIAAVSACLDNHNLGWAENRLQHFANRLRLRQGEFAPPGAKSHWRANCRPPRAPGLGTRKKGTRVLARSATLT